MSERGRGGGAIWWAALSEVPGVGAATMLRLARVFGSPEAALAAPVEELIARGELTPEQAREVHSSGESMEALRARIEAYAQQGIRLISREEAEYPRALLDLRSPPPLLYVKGELRAEDTRAVAVVGTRDPNREGARVARLLAREFARRGFTIVSGLARGIDTAGHKGALEARGRSIAVLGSGLLRVYPPENKLLARRVAQHGALLAEVPPDMEVDRRFLLARDRIQAALSRAVIVIQAHRECGSIVTARHAVQCRRLLYGVPWTKEPFLGGGETLQGLGARPITAESDLEEIAADIESWTPPEGQQSLL